MSSLEDETELLPTTHLSMPLERNGEYCHYDLSQRVHGTWLTLCIGTTLLCSLVSYNYAWQRATHSQGIADGMNHFKVGKPSKWHCASLVNSGYWVDKTFLYDSFEAGCQGPRMLSVREMGSIVTRFDKFIFVGCSVTRRLARHVSFLDTESMHFQFPGRILFDSLKTDEKIHHNFEVGPRVSFMWAPTLYTINQVLKHHLKNRLLSHNGSLVLVFDAGLHDLLSGNRKVRPVGYTDPEFPNGTQYADSLMEEISDAIEDLRVQASHLRLTIIWRTEPRPAFYDDRPKRKKTIVYQKRIVQFPAFDSLILKTFGNVANMNKESDSQVAVLDHAEIMMPMTVNESIRLTGNSMEHLNSDGRWVLLNTFISFLGYITR